MSRPLRAVIHTQSLKHNLQRVRELAPDSKIMAVIKADGYGHGILNVASALQDVDAFAVASIDEAITIDGKLAKQTPICLLEGVFAREELTTAAERGFMLVVHSAQQVEWLEQEKLSQPLTIWLKIDTGMNRLGIDVAEFESLYQRLLDCSNVKELALMSHFACADDESSKLNQQQITRFEELASAKQNIRSMANSAGIVQWPAGHYEWVRPGIMLYGSSPVSGKDASALDLKPVMSLQSELVAVKHVKQGDSVGYGATWNAAADTRIGVVACGYGDGYPRHIAAGTPVLINNKRAPIVGRVSMDMITVDLGSLPQAKAGDAVLLWGEGLSVDEIAGQAGTISYELLCQVTPRVPREVV